LISSSKDDRIDYKGASKKRWKALESIKEKDLKITRMQDALTKKDSVTLALVTSQKTVRVQWPRYWNQCWKGVVFISIADKLLFKSGSYTVTDKAKGVLAKVAKVVNDKTWLNVWLKVTLIAYLT
jgi:chemotaxis protein MotB